MHRVIGGAMILAASVLYGFIRQKNQLHVRRELDTFSRILRHMIRELRDRRLPLPALLRQGAEAGSGGLEASLTAYAMEIEHRCILPDEKRIVQLLHKHDLSPATIELLTSLFRTFGSCDLSAQLREMELLHDRCLAAVVETDKHMKENEHLIRTLALCCGAAIVILLI